MFRNTIIFLLLMCLFSLLNAQSFGGFPPSKPWSQLKNDNYTIIFSPENEISARRTAAVIDQMNRLQHNIGLKRRNINIVLQNSTTLANGYVGLAPFISEFFLTPFPNSFGIGSLPWPYTLGIHEYQHVLQYANSYYGASKWGHFLGGEATWGAMQSLSIPNWFFEGDAVRAETEYTNQGRGRIPTFYNGFRAFAAQKQIPSYAKMRNGSFRDYVPNHYPLGYLLVRYGREKYGQEFWPNVLKDAASYRGIIYPFSRALKRNGAEHSTKFYRSMMEDFTQEWESEDISPDSSLFEVGKHEVMNHAFPQFDADSSLYFVQSSYDQIAQVFQQKNGELIPHLQLGLRSDNYIHVHQGKIVFTQRFFDKRWGWIDYQDVVVYDSKTKKRKRLTKKGKYFHPSFSPNGEKLVALEALPNHQFSLVILNAKTGEEIQKIENPKNYYFTYPTWFGADQIVSATRDSSGRMFLAKIHLQDGRIETGAPSYHIIGRPTVHQDVVYYTSTYSGVDNLYSYSNGKTQQLTQGGLGRYSPVVNPSNDSVYFTSFSLNGTHLSRVKLKEKPFQVAPLNTLDFYNPEYMETSPHIATESINDSLPVSSYSKFKKLINIHSWGFNFNDPEYNFELISGNILNTLDLTAGYTYNSNERTVGFQVDADYGQYLLHFNASLSNSNRSIARLNSPDVFFNQTQTAVGLSLPLNFSSNLSTRYVRIASNYSYLFADFEDESFSNQHIQSLTNQIVYLQRKIKARKNIFTHLGIYTRWFFRNALDEDAHQFVTQNSLALRGLFKNHNLIVDADAQIDVGTGNYLYSDLFVFSRGYQNLRFSEQYRTSANYHFPIAYPDKGTMGIAYLKRIRGNLFYDHTWVNATSDDFVSLGAELILDIRWLNTLSIPMGLRYSHALTNSAFSAGENGGYFELFLPLNRF